MLKRTPIAFGIVMLATFAVWAREPAEEDKSSLKVADLAWMAGRWQAPAKSGFTDEHWSEPLNGAMNGMCRIGDNAKRAVYEILLIEEVDGDLVYSMMHFGPGLKPREQEPMKFDVEKGTKDKEVVFVGREKEKGTRLIYHLATPDQLVCVLEKTRGGKQSRNEFRMNRVKAE